jgi:hypothetical protein
MNADSVGVVSGSRAEAHVSGSPKGEPLRPIQHPRKIKMPFGVERRRTIYLLVTRAVATDLRSKIPRFEPVSCCGTDTAEPHIRSPIKRLTPKFLIAEVGLGRTRPFFMTACFSQDIMRFVHRDLRGELSDGIRMAYAAFSTAPSGISPRLT